MSKKLNEGISAGDLDFLISNKIHFDEYNSKMGRADSVVTASFKVKQREPALDLVSFLETGYDWILDADVSSGEIKDGEFIVFLEMQRRRDLSEKVIKLLNDLQHLTNLKIEKWQFKWYKQDSYQPVTEQNLTNIIPNNPKSYRETIEQFTKIKVSTDNLNSELSRLKMLSGV
jgi:hypothetical protein